MNEFYEVRGLNKYMLKKLGWDIEDPEKENIRQNFEILPGDLILGVKKEAVQDALSIFEIKRYIETKGYTSLPEEFDKLKKQNFSKEALKETIAEEEVFWKFIALHIISLDDDDFCGNN